MKYKKYLVFIVLLMIFGIDRIYADYNECYYQSNDASLYYNPSTGKFRIDQRGNNTDIKAPNDPLINKDKDVTDGYRFLYFNGTGITVKAVNGCPNYIVYRRYNGVWFFNSDGIWGFNNQSDASDFASASNQIKNLSAVIASYKDAGGNKITSEQYYNQLSNVKAGANINNNSKYGTNGINTSNSQLSCEQLFDSSIIDLVNDILKYPRYIVPILILALGTLDLFKAVIAGKEDEMKKAQSTFIKRIIIGVGVFLVPVFINAIMWLANIAWEGLGFTTCNL